MEACYRELGFTGSPFSITPDTEFFYPGGQHTAALSCMGYGMASGGFALLTGEVGLGKTLLCRYLLRHPPSGVQTAYIFNPAQSYEDLLSTIYHDLTGEWLSGVTAGPMQRAIYDHLLQMAAEGRRAAVVIDEAHRLAPELLESLRLLSNLDTEKQKLLSLMLVGQPELDRTLALRAMRPLAQRIALRHHLVPFNRKETEQYIRHRVLTARERDFDFEFSPSAVSVIHRAAQGVPRRINQIADRAVLGAFAADTREVGWRLARRAAREVRKGTGI
nr:AAA family ATPase [Halorhodospira abdelmalekii]